MNAAEPSAPALRFDGVSMRFADGTVAVEGVTASVGANEFVSVVGPSGCGKSTLLRIAAGLTRPSGGAVDAPAGGVGFVFQEPTLLPWRTVERNVELVGELERVPRVERADRVRAAIDLVGLAEFRRHYPRALSGGMKMRVSLARALTLRPKLFLLDEPFGALDELTRERLNDELARICARERFAALFVTHSVIEATYLSHRVLVMSARPGRIVGEFTVPLPFPREERDRFSPELAAVAGEISRCLRAHAAAP